MKPLSKPPSVVRVPHPPRLVLGALCVLLSIVLFGSTAAAGGPKHKGGKSDKGPAKTTPSDKGDKGSGKPEKPPVLDFTGLNFQGQLHTPQLLYFLDRANEELERASLERRSFIPEMVKSVDEDDL